MMRLEGRTFEIISCRSSESMKKKDSFVLYTSQMDAVCALSDEDAGRLLKAIYTYHSGESVPELAPLPNLVFLMMRPIFDRDALKWEETARKRREAGSKGGKARAGGISAEETALAELEREFEAEAEEEIQIRLGV